MKKINLFATAAIKALELEIQAAWVERDMEKCIQLLNKVLELDPKCLDAHLMIGRAHGMRYEYDEAFESFEKAITIAPEQSLVETIIKAGNMARNFFDPTIAEALFEEAVQTGGNVSAKIALAEHSLRMRKRKSAEVMIAEVLESHPGHPEALLLWCRMNEKRVDECDAMLRHIISKQTAELKSKAAYQLAKCLDIAGDFDGAMQALVTAKSVLWQGKDVVVQNRSRIRERHINLAREFSVSKRHEWQSNLGQLNDIPRLVLLGGHPRSGTTLLEQVLDSHSEAISAEETENFYSFALSPLMRNHLPVREEMAVLNSCSLGDLMKARESYFAAMNRCLGESVGSRLLIDKNPSLTSLVPAMFRIFPEMRFVTMIRDPRDVVLSCYMQSFVPVSAISGNYLTLEDTAAEYSGVMGVWIEVSKHLEGCACEIRYEEMVEDLEGNARRVLDFLGLEWDESVMEYDRHAREKVVRSPTANAVTEKVHSRAKNRWKNYEKYLEPVFDTLAPCLDALGYA